MTTATTHIIGSYVSPYVRKVLVSLELKGVAYTIDPIVPFFGGDEFSRLSPLRRIPVLIDDRITVADSTVICEYLEDRYPRPALYPAGAERRARARWLEEFADARLGEAVIWHLFYQLVVRRAVWREKPDEALVARAREVEIPQILDYLEGELPASGHLFGELCVADIAVATFFRNAGFARYAVDAARWPVTAGFVERTLAHPAFLKLRPFEELELRTPPVQARAALAAAGAPVCEVSLGTDAPRRGVMDLSFASTVAQSPPDSR